MYKTHSLINLVSDKKCILRSMVTQSCEVWKDLLGESHHVAATVEEKEALDSICRTIDLKLQMVVEKQDLLRERREYAELEDERLFYEKVVGYHKV